MAFAPAVVEQRFLLKHLAAMSDLAGSRRFAAANDDDDDAVLDWTLAR